MDRAQPRHHVHLRDRPFLKTHGHRAGSRQDATPPNQQVSQTHPLLRLHRNKSISPPPRSRLPTALLPTRREPCTRKVYPLPLTCLKQLGLPPPADPPRWRLHGRHLRCLRRAARNARLLQPYGHHGVRGSQLHGHERRRRRRVSEPASGVVRGDETGCDVGFETRGRRWTEAAALVRRGSC